MNGLLALALWFTASIFVAAVFFLIDERIDDVGRRLEARRIARRTLADLVEADEARK